MSTNWAVELDTELSEATTTMGTETARARPLWTSAWSTWCRRQSSSRWLRIRTSTSEVDAEDLVDDVDEDLSDGRLGAALVFATVSLIGIGLGSCASLMAAPTPVMVAVWVIAALAGLLALRQLTWGGAR